MKTKTVIICRDWKELEDECLKLECNHIKSTVGSGAWSTQGASPTCGIKCECGVELRVRKTYNNASFDRIMHVLDRWLDENATPEERKEILVNRVYDDKHKIISLNSDLYHSDGTAKLQSEIKMYIE